MRADVYPATIDAKTLTTRYANNAVFSVVSPSASCTSDMALRTTADPPKKMTVQTAYPEIIESMCMIMARGG